MYDSYGHAMEDGRFIAFWWKSPFDPYDPKSKFEAQTFVEGVKLINKHEPHVHVDYSVVQFVFFIQSFVF